jgi:hypothetical protein
MRVTTIAAVLAFASLGVGSASAAGPRTDDNRFSADFGLGGWAFDAHVRPPASGAIAVAPNARSETEYRAAAPGGFADRERLWLWLSSDSDCVFGAQPTSVDSHRTPGCK